MLCYRISRIIYADLSGNGARLYGGRWNSEGKSMVYLASSRSLAVLEALAHLSPTNIPDDLCMMIVDVPDDAFIELDMNILPPHWTDFPEQNILKQMGNRFLAEGKELMLKVPSAIVSEEYNYLFNPLHPKAIKAKILSKKPFGFDARLL
ncbi:MAG: RES family NAD+ phosphorylase [Bacteroidota bacterium]